MCHHRAKAAAAMAGQSLKAFLIDALQVAVDKDEKKRRRRCVFGLTPNVVRFLIVGRVTQLLGALYTYRIEQDWDHEQDWDDDAVQ